MQNWSEKYEAAKVASVVEMALRDVADRIAGRMSEAEQRRLESSQELLAACRAADEVAGKTTIRPAGEKHRRVFAIPVESWEAVRAALAKATA